MFGRASLGQRGPWYYHTYWSKAAGFTWWNLPVINSLARVHSLWGHECLLCVWQEFSLPLLVTFLLRGVGMCIFHSWEWPCCWSNALGSRFSTAPVFPSLLFTVAIKRNKSELLDYNPLKKKALVLFYLEDMCFLKKIWHFNREQIDNVILTALQTCQSCFATKPK